MDVDAYSTRHRQAWARLNYLAGRRKPTGAEADELVDLYRRTSQQLARLQTHSPEPELVAGLSAVLARARGRIVGSSPDTWTEIRRFFTHRFPAAVYGTFGWWLAVAVVFLTVVVGFATWVSADPSARGSLGLPEDTGALTAPGGAFETYYTEHPNDAFAALVWTNNAWVCALALFLGVLILPVLYLLFMNALNIGVTAGLMADAGRLDSLFGFLLPHGMLELTAIFIAGGAGLRLGWTLVDPGRASRTEAMARQGRLTATIALGLVPTLLVAGLLEGFVTPSALPAPIRIACGLLAETLFLVYIFTAGRRAYSESETSAARSTECG
ncbi:MULTISPECIES: stage II sporulation protein M [Nocardia]|uniref:stage II sporulation protein M n=1 Tax=Nocardia TaxID=1817 RepID=UPI001893248A|nr:MULTISPECIES: stage II sporulation protein M [Nocardia]MBF6350080.1 stage II sporulation protein M [Nocardia flavorosea]